MTLTTIAVNGVPIESYGLTPIQFEEWRSAPVVKYGAVQVIGQMGQNPSLAGISYSRPPLLLGVRTSGVSLAADATAAGAWYLAAQGRLELEAMDQPGRILSGYFESAKAVPQNTAVTFIDPKLELAGVLTFPDPFWYARQPVTFGAAAAGAAVVVPIGTAPSRLRVWIAGPYTNPTVTLTDRTGTMIAQLRFTDTAADATVVLDLCFGTQRDATSAVFIDRYVSGVRSAANNGYSLLNAADSPGQFPIDPLDAPMISINSGALAGIAWRSYLA